MGKFGKKMYLNITEWLCLRYPWQICFLMMIANVLAPVWRQDTRNHHDEANSSFGKRWYKSPFGHPNTAFIRSRKPIWHQDICSHHDEAHLSFGNECYRSPYWLSQHRCFHWSRNQSQALPGTPALRQRPRYTRDLASIIHDGFEEYKWKTSLCITGLKKNQDDVFVLSAIILLLNILCPYFVIAELKSV